MELAFAQEEKRSLVEYLHDDEWIGEASKLVCDEDGCHKPEDAGPENPMPSLQSSLSQVKTESRQSGGR